MFFLVYVSSATQPFSPSELIALMSKSAASNSQLGLTGMLLHKDGNFMQVLEGDEAIVRDLYTKISVDRRHTGLLPLLHGHQQAREFPDWSMAFRELNSPEVTSLPGYSQFLNSPLTAAEFGADPSRSHKLLTTFKKSM